MNMAAGISSPQCPKCSRSVGQWTDRQITHICASCGAPLIRFRASGALRLYRIFPVAELIRITGLLVTVAAILSAVVFPRGLHAAVFMVATALLSFGAADVIQETFAMRVRRRRSDAIIGGPKAQTWRAVARMIAGLTCLMLSFVGFMIWASVTTEM